MLFLRPAIIKSVPSPQEEKSKYPNFDKLQFHFANRKPRRTTFFLLSRRKEKFSWAGVKASIKAKSSLVIPPFYAFWNCRNNSEREGVSTDIYDEGWMHARGRKNKNRKCSNLRSLNYEIFFATSRSLYFCILSFAEGSAIWLGVPC